MYRTIETSLWDDPRVRELMPDGKLLFVYLITNRHAHVSGIYYLPPPTAAYELGIPAKRYQYCIDTLSSAGLVTVDRVSSVIWVRNMLRYQAAGPKVMAGVAAHLLSLHNNPLIPQFLEAYPAVLPHYERGNVRKAGRKTNLIPKRLRFQVLERDKHTCQSCGRNAPDVELEVVPRTSAAKGGKTVIENLVSLCHDCNNGKSDTDPSYPIEGVSIQEQEQEQEQKKTPPAKTRKGGNHDIHADAFKAAFDSAFPDAGGYTWNTADFVQLDKWRKSHSAISPEQFVAVAVHHWGRGQYTPGASMTIKGLCSGWASLAAQASKNGDGALATPRDPSKTVSCVNDLYRDQLPKP